MFNGPLLSWSINCLLECEENPEYRLRQKAEHEKKKFKAHWKIQVEEFKVLYNKALHNRDYYLYDPICSK